jgi:hypothetical protein
MSPKEKKRLLEAEKIFSSIFNSPPPPLLKERYLEAAQRFSKNYTATEIAECQKAIGKIGDLEALELAARHTGKLPLLVLKFRIMTYLAEGSPLSRKFYINDTDAPMTGWFSLFYGGMRTAAKLVKGILLMVYLKI